MEIILDDMGGPNVITKVPKIERQRFDVEEEAV